MGAPWWVGLARVRWRRWWVLRLAPVRGVSWEMALEEVVVLGGPRWVAVEPPWVVDQVVRVCGKPVLDGLLGLDGLRWLWAVRLGRLGLWVRRLRVVRAGSLAITLAVMVARPNLAPFLLPPAVGVTTPFVRALRQAHALAVVLSKGNSS